MHCFPPFQSEWAATNYTLRKNEKYKPLYRIQFASNRPFNGAFVGARLKGAIGASHGGAEDAGAELQNVASSLCRESRPELNRSQAGAPRLIPIRTFQLEG